MEKIQETDIVNMSANIRKMALDGYCIKPELDDMKEIISLHRHCSNNLNQYAKKADETGNTYAEGMVDLKIRLDSIWEGCKEMLTWFASIRYAHILGTLSSFLNNNFFTAHF